LEPLVKVPSIMPRRGEALPRQNLANFNLFSSVLGRRPCEIACRIEDHLEFSDLTISSLMENLSLPLVVATICSKGCHIMVQAAHEKHKKYH
jgi:hypothetical protein